MAFGTGRLPWGSPAGQTPQPARAGPGGQGARRQSPGGGRGDPDRGSKKWSHSYNKYEDVPDSLKKQILGHIDPVNCNVFLTDQWEDPRIADAYLQVGVGITDDHHIRFRNDMVREWDALKAEYTRRGEVFKTLKHDDIMSQAQAFWDSNTVTKYVLSKADTPNGPRCFVVENSSKRSAWLPANVHDWCVRTDDSDSRRRLYVASATPGASSLWLDELFPSLSPPPPTSSAIGGPPTTSASFGGPPPISAPFGGPPTATASTFPALAPPPQPEASLKQRQQQQQHQQQ